MLPLLEFSKVVNASLDLRFVLGTLLLTLLGNLLVTKGIVLLRKQKNVFHVENGKGISKDILHSEIVLTRVPKKSFTVSRSSPSGFEKLYEAGITRLFPIISHTAVIGYFGIAERPHHPVTKEQRKLIDTLINISASAIDKSMAFDELNTVNRTLDGKIHELKTLFELGKGFSGILEKESLLRLFSLTLMGQVGTNRYAICLKEGTSIYSKIDGTDLESNKAAICDIVTVPILSRNIPQKKKFLSLRNFLNEQKISALIPLELQNEVKGVLCLGERLRGGTYAQSDLEFIYSLANLAFVSLENSRLFDEAIEKKKLESELLIAKEIQQRLLPSELPVIRGFEVAGLNISSNQVGGDYYDVIPSSDDNYIFVIADVSGKGTPASLLMSNVQATVHAFVPMNLPLSNATSRINDLIHRNTGTDKFITFFWGSLDPRKRTFHYVNAGHNPPLVLRKNGTIERLTEGGLILGVMKTIVPYKEGTVSLSPGDTVVMYTDGVSEAMDINGMDYSEEKLESFIAGCRGKTAEEMLDAIRNEVQRYTAGAPQSDDITLVVFRAL